MQQENLSFANQDQIRALFGCQDRFLRQVRDRLNVQVVVRGDELRLSGDSPQVQTALKVFAELQQIIDRHGELAPSEVSRVLDRHLEPVPAGAEPIAGSDQDLSAGARLERGLATGFSAVPRSESGSGRSQNSGAGRQSNHSGNGKRMDSSPIDLFEKARQVRPRTEGQARYVAAIRKNDLVICSDEIHCDLLLDETQHIPIAALDPATAARTVTLMAPSKTYNVPGLGASFAIVQDKELRQRVERAAMGIVPHVNILGAVAMEAAYRHGDAWLHALRAYLTANNATKPRRKGDRSSRTAA